MTKYLIAIVLIVAAFGGGYYVVSSNEKAPTGDHVSETTTTSESEHAIASPWTFTDAGEIDGVPRTQVFVDVHGTPVNVGRFEGYCADMQGSEWTIREGAAYGAICWFAGGGTEIGVFHEGGTHVVKTAILDEGTAEESGVRGEMVTKISL